MNTNREIINSYRKKIQERNADSTFSNKDLYNSLISHAQWLIKREISSGRIYVNPTFFQTLGCQEVIETSTIEECCPIKVNCKIYRTKNKVPEMWIDNDGPVIKSITSVDGTTEFFRITANNWQAKRRDPYNRMSSQKYSFYENGYIWFPEHNPHLVNIQGFYTKDITDLSSCASNKGCRLFLDQVFPVPGWLHAEMFSKALQQDMPSKQMQDDENIDKNPTRKN